MKTILGIITVSIMFFSIAFAEQYCVVGSEKWVAGCEAKCTDSWEGGDCPRTCTATAPPGFVIINYRHVTISESNGGHDVSRISADQRFDYKLQIERAYNYALDLAGKANNKAAEAKIKQDMKLSISEAESFESSHQMVRLRVSASKHGSVIDRKSGWSHHRVDLRIKCIVPRNLEDQLAKKYALQ